MSTERKLQLSVAILCTLSAVLMGLSLHSPQHPFMMLLAAVAAHAFSDRWNWIRLNRFFANAAMILAAMLSLNDFIPRDSENQLMAIGSLLTWVQMILLFQAKNTRVYGSLAVFSLLQIVVAALLSMGFEFGVFLMIYLAVATWFLGLYLSYQEIVAVQLSARADEPKRTKDDASRSGPLETYRRLLRQRPEVTDFGRLAKLDRDVSQSHTGRDLAILCSTSLIFAFVFFFCAPRYMRSPWQRNAGVRNMSVGFTRSVSLDQMSNVLQNLDPVMRIGFYDPKQRKPIEVLGGAYIHGVVLTEYDWNEKGNWSPNPAVGPGSRLSEAPTGNVVIQDILLEPSRDATMFATWPIYSVDETPRGIRIEENSRRLFHVREDDLFGRPRQFHYALGTNSIRNGDQAPVIPYLERLDRAFHSTEANDYGGRYLDKIRGFTNSVLDEQFPESRSTFRVCRYLENYLRSSPDFKYSLNLEGIPRDKNLDPVEDFLMNHRTGYCSFFASALALMLRSQGIETRLVIGFRSNEFNPVGGYYIVRQRDAHAWVEARLAPHEIDKEDLPKGETAEHGGWLRLDPTPASRGDRDDVVIRGVFDRIDEYLDYAQLLWTEHVLGLNRDRQSSMIFRPFSEQADSAADMIGASPWTRFVRWVRAKLGLAPNDRFMDWFTLPRMMGLIVLGAIATLVFRLIRRQYSSRRTPQPQTLPKDMAPLVDFYARWENLLRQIGKTRTRTQTQKEFSLEGARDIPETMAGPCPMSVGRMIVDAFYRVRFGSMSIDDQERQAIELALDNVAKAIHARRDGTTPRQSVAEA